MLALLLCGVMDVAYSYTSVLLVLSENGGAYREAAETMRAYLTGQGDFSDVRTIHVDELAAARANLAEQAVIVAIGTYAMEQAALDSRAPVLNILVPRQNYEATRLRAKLDARQFSAVYLDQPLSRQLRLIKTALPNRDTVGVLLGPFTNDRLKLLQQLVREQKMTVKAESVSAEDEIVPALKRLLPNAEVLLALPDPLVFNKNTAQSLLLTSYRAQVPLIAYSKSYVGAGALAAVYSTPTQIGQHAAELIGRQGSTKPSSLPAAQYPKYFSVSVNYQVARSLGLAIEDEATLLERIKASSERE